MMTGVNRISFFYFCNMNLFLCKIVFNSFVSKFLSVLKLKFQQSSFSRLFLFFSGFFLFLFFLYLITCIRMYFFLLLFVIISNAALSIVFIYIYRVYQEHATLLMFFCPCMSIEQFFEVIAKII